MRRPATAKNVKFFHFQTMHLCRSLDITNDSLWSYMTETNVAVHVFICLGDNCGVQGQNIVKDGQNTNFTS